MDNVFLFCAVGGGTVLVCQVIVTLLGLGGHGELGGELGGHDVGHDGAHDGAHDGHDSSWFFGFLTFRTVIAAITFFGLTGKTALAADAQTSTALIIALAGGAAAMFAVHGAMQLLHRLKADGTVRLERSVGHVGVVYLSIPAARAGAGKIHLNLQNRTVECQAFTAGGRLVTGARVVVTAVVGPDTVEVESLPTGDDAPPRSAPSQGGKDHVSQGR